MPKTLIDSTQIRSVTRSDLDVTTVGGAVVAKIIAGTGVTVTSTGADSGTGDVTINASGGSTPTGTGFTHITSGVQDGAAVAVDVSSANITGVLKSASFPALTGDVTTASGSLATTIANNAVTLAKMATQADQTILGNVSGGSAVPVALTKAQVNTMLGAPVATNIIKFTASGTYTKSTGVKSIRLLMWGAGAGGGSGGVNAVSGGQAGGGGGGAGGAVDLVIDPTALGSTVTVTVGSGGSGGASQSTNATAGNNGSAGGTTSFGTIAVPQGAFGGGGGASGFASGNGGAGGSGVGVTSSVQNPNTNAATYTDAVTVDTLGVTLGSNGGAGGSLSSANATMTGCAAADCVDPSKITVYAAGGSYTNTDGTAGGNGHAGNSGIYLQAGSGGGGGAWSLVGNGGAGGNGGIPSGGGAGGGACYNGFSSGAGGAGARGEVWVIEFF